MADKVQLTIENMLPELDMLVQYGIFSKKEVKKIVKKRRYYEYQFEKKDVDKVDYFKAIRYEKILNKRRIAKKKELQIKRTDYYDFHFLRRIVFLYKKCLVKFNHDEAIWMEFLNYLIKNKCYNILNKEIGQCLVNFPHNLTFWKIAVYSEFESSFNSITARSLMQKCLRLNSRNIDAHLEYFIFEIKFSEKLTERRKILTGENEQKLKMLQNEEKAGQEEKEGNEDEIASLKIPEIIWKQALEAFPTDATNFKFLSALMNYGQKVKYKELKNKIISAIIHNNSNDNIQLRLKIIHSLLFKYNGKELIKKALTKFSKLILSYPINTNEIISELFQTVECEITKDDSLSDSDKENIFEIIIQKVLCQINFNELIEQYHLNYNMNILRVLINNLTKSRKCAVQSEIEINFNEIIQKILALIFISEDSLSLSKIFKIWANLISQDSQEDLDGIFQRIQDLISSGGGMCKSSEFGQHLIENLCNLIEDDISFYKNSQKAEYYFQKLDSILQSFKFPIFDFLKLKRIYFKILFVIYNKIFEAIPKGEDLDVNQISESIEYAEYFKALRLIKKKMQRYLLNYQAIQSEVLKKVYNNILYYMNCIDPSI